MERARSHPPNITNVAVTCTAAATYSVGGTVSGLSGTVVLQDNGSDNLTVSSQRRVHLREHPDGRLAL